MDRRRISSDVAKPPLVETSPLIDPKRLRSCRGLSQSVSVIDSGSIHPLARSSTLKPNSLKPISESGPQGRQGHQQQQTLSLDGKCGVALNRSQSAPHYRLPHCMAPPPPPPLPLRSPQYRVNPVVKFDDRTLPPQRMNYGIAGYNTSRPRGFSSIPETVTIATPRPRSFVEAVSETTTMPKPRARSFSSVPDSSASSRPRSSISRNGQQTPRPAAGRAVVWRSLTRRFRDKMGRIRVRDTCSKLLSRFRG